VSWTDERIEERDANLNSFLSGSSFFSSWCSDFDPLLLGGEVFFDQVFQKPETSPERLFASLGSPILCFSGTHPFLPPLFFPSQFFDRYGATLLFPLLKNEFERAEFRPGAKPGNAPVAMTRLRKFIVKGRKEGVKRGAFPKSRGFGLHYLAIQFCHFWLLLGTPSLGTPSLAGCLLAVAARQASSEGVK
jgi:hypothetical protein